TRSTRDWSSDVCSSDLEALVREIDFRRQVVHLDDGQLSYDHLVIALGSVTNFFGQEEQARAALTLKTAGDALAVRNRLIDAFERSEERRVGKRGSSRSE